MSALPPEVQRYLARAGALLPRHAAHRVRAELAGNLYQTMLDARVAGLGEAEAWRAALTAAGPVLGTTLRLARVHTTGLALRWLLAGVCLGGAGYALQGGPHAQPPAHGARP